jgi:S1-C subfamily serine protease
MDPMEEMGAAIAEVAERVGASVVGIGHRWAVGSGVVVGPGQVLTNAHNLRGDAVHVTLADGSRTRGRVLGVDVDGDIGVVGVETGDAPAISWSGDGGIGIGTAVLALANPGGRGLRVTIGFVSGTARSFRGPRGRRITGSLEHTAPLLPGSSGGPVVDRRGTLLGVNTNRLGEGFYLALPADEELHRRVEALGRGESPVRPRLGIGIAPVEVAHRLRRAVGLSEVDGVLVRLVEEGSPAARAGLAEGDLIVAIDERAVGSADDLHDALEQATGHPEVTLRLVRGDQERTVSVSLERPAA